MLLGVVVVEPPKTFLEAFSLLGVPPSPLKKPLSLEVAVEVAPTPPNIPPAGVVLLAVVATGALPDARYGHKLNSIPLAFHNQLCVCFKLTQNQGLRRLLLTLSWDLCAWRGTPDGVLVSLQLRKQRTRRV